MSEHEKNDTASPAPTDRSVEVGPDVAEYERKLVRKLDMNIVPVIMLLYLLSFLDRINIGSARLYGMEEDLGMVGNQYQLAVSILFVTYLACEIPGNLVLKKFTPRYYIASIAVSWGIIATLTGTVQSYGGLLACRLLLGVAEASLFPGLAVYLTLFYTKGEFAVRIGYLIVSAALAGAFGGLLAYAIGFMDGIAGMSAWRWILILEGIPTVLMGVVTWFVFADDPDTAWYLTEDERQFCVKRLGREVEATVSARQFHWADVKKCFTDWKCYCFALAQFGMATMLYGYANFLPTIIKSIGGTAWSNAHVQALTIPCYALGAITFLIVARLSDVQQRRGLYIIILAIVAIIGYGILLADASSGVHYFGCFLVAMGLFGAGGLPIAWLSSNSPRYGKRTAATGLQLTCGNFAGVMAPFLYPNSDRPRFIKGHAVTLAMVGFGVVMYSILWAAYAKLNRNREERKEDWKLEDKTWEEVAEMGDESPRYKYTI